MRSKIFPITFFINYFNIYNLAFSDNIFRDWCRFCNLQEIIVEIDEKKENCKRFSLAYAKLFTTWFLKNAGEALCELYYAILDENIRKCFDYCDMLPPPPEVQQRVYPPNIKNILVEYENYKLERVRDIKDDPFKPTNLKEFADAV